MRESIVAFVGIRRVYLFGLAALPPPAQMVLMQTGTKKEMRFVGYDFNYLSVSVVVCVYVHACILPFIHILVGTNQNFRPRWWKKRKKNQAPGACALLTTLQWDFRGSDRHRLLVMPPQSLVRVGLAAVEPLSPPPPSLLLFFAGWGLSS